MFTACLDRVVGDWRRLVGRPKGSKKIRTDMEIVGEALRDERRRLAARERELKKKCDWTDRGDVLFYRRERKRRSREARLNWAVPDRRCPHCGRLKVESRRWRVTFDREALRYRAICLSCHRAGALGGPRTMEKLPLPVVIFAAEQPRYRVNPRMLRLAREQTGLSSKDFGAWMGWSGAWQQALESGKVKTVTQETRDIIAAFLKARGAQLCAQEKRHRLEEDVGEVEAPQFQFLKPIADQMASHDEDFQTEVDLE